MQTWLVVHAAATWAMVGFIWTVQLLVYPTMSLVPVPAFAAYEHYHQRRIVAVLAPFAVVEVVAAAALAFVDTGVPAVLWLTGGLLLAALWVSTGAFFAPLHGRLAAGFDPGLHARLVRSNWLRTVAWTARGLLATAMLVVAAG
ncbi:MAG: hypothetical protein ACLGHQ_11040 [Acidimicrobiia bacterium]